METNKLIVVGGPISVGKSTLTNNLPWPAVSELDNDDKIQELLLENTYNKGRVHPIVIENYFLQLRKKRYESHAFRLLPSILDRSIFESLWFAKGNMDEKTYGYFETLWRNIITEILEKFGKPHTYILLICSWDTFKDRLFKRSRSVEIANFSENEEFFKKHIAEYEDHMTNIFKEFDINHIIINTDNLSEKEVLEIALEQLDLD